MQGFIRHEGCPKCGSRDNVGVYEQDGQEWKWCFSCRQFIEKPIGKTLDGIRRALTGESTQSQYCDVLPEDYTPYFQKTEAWEWLTSYGLTKDEIARNLFGWSASREMLVTPVYRDDSLVFWQGRYFPKRKPKTFSSGKPIQQLLGAKSSRDVRGVTVVEDKISAIKVARQFPCVVLWGTHLNSKTALQLSKMYDRLLVWLDEDATDLALKHANHYRMFFKEGAGVIRTSHDPKQLSDTEILKVLTQ